MAEVHIDLAERAHELRVQRELAEQRRQSALARLARSAEQNQDVADILTLLLEPA